MSFFYPLNTMERRLPIIDSGTEASGGCGSAGAISPLEKRKNMRKMKKKHRVGERVAESSREKGDD